MDSEPARTDRDDDSAIDSASSPVKVKIQFTDDERRDVHKALSALIGMPLSDMIRYCGWQRFEFGEQIPAKNKRGEDVTISDWAISLNCPWRIEGPDGFSLTSEDFEPERHDDHAEAFYDRFESDPISVESVSVESNGALTFFFSEGFVLNAKPANELEPEFEEWWFFPPESGAVPSFSLGYEGLWRSSQAIS